MNWLANMWVNSSTTEKFLLSGTALVAGAGLAYVAVVAVSGGATIAVAKVVGKVGVQVVVRLGPAAIAAIGATDAAGAKDA